MITAALILATGSAVLWLPSRIDAHFRRRRQLLAAQTAEEREYGEALAMTYYSDNREARRTIRQAADKMRPRGGWETTCGRWLSQVADNWNDRPGDERNTALHIARTYLTTH